MNGWRKYLKTLHDEKINEFVRITEKKKELNRILCRFSVKATSRSEKEYEPDTLTCRQAPTLHDHVL